MRRLVDEVIQMRRSAKDGVARLLAEACLEICFQELAANDEGLNEVQAPTAEEILMGLFDLGPASSKVPNHA